MSFMDKVGSMMMRPGEDAVPKDEVPWWMKYLGRGLGTVGGGIAIFLGLWNCVGILLADVGCLVSGMWQMVAGFSVIVIEAPCCCLFIDSVQTLSDFVDKRPYWNRAAYYCGVAIPAIIFCPGLGSVFGSGLIFGTGVVYGMMSLGKKGSREDMAAMASPTGVTVSHPGGVPSDQTLMEDPDIWRPT
uniref:Calcium channel flower n=1 Tax=Lygus hesperus TaxID=30085 RepID=A0A0A9WJ01_LYGHE